VVRDIGVANSSSSSSSSPLVVVKKSSSQSIPHALTCSFLGSPPVFFLEEVLVVLKQEDCELVDIPQN